MSKSRIISFDPGYDRLGWAIGSINNRRYQLETCGRIETNPKAGILERYQEIISDIKNILVKYKPDEAAIETLFFSTNKTTAMKVSEVRGIIISLLIQANIPVTQYNPQLIKLTVTGYGHSDKIAMHKMVLIQTKLDDQNNQKILDDTIDAIAVGMTHAIVNTSKL